MADNYATFIEHVKEIYRLETVEAILEWDQETQMPPKGVEARAELTAMVAAMKHDRWTDPKLGELIESAPNDGDPINATNIREARRQHLRAVRVPTELVKEFAQTSALARDIWAKARKASDFKQFAPSLEKLLDLKRRQAEHIGYEDEIYDALLDEFEPGAKTADIAKTFAELRDQLAPLVRDLAAAANKPDFSILKRHYPRAGQQALGRRFVEQMHFDLEAGRIDVSTHPFCLTAAIRDVRLTTRYLEDFLPSAIFGLMHEAGHGLYEQGLDNDHQFTPMGKAVSLGIHESQSRMWENLVGRSRPFWEHNYAEAQPLFPDALGNVSLDAFHRAVNTVAPSLIRVEADEVTYNLHIIVRFELERDLLTKKLAVADVPQAWNQKMTDLVGITPPTDRDGCLQDIHWSLGIFGYFPTYCLGNLYAAQFYETAKKALPDLDQNIAAGNLLPLREWLRTNIHQHGMRYLPADLCQHVTGKPLTIEPFMRYVNGKFRGVYDLHRSR